MKSVNAVRFESLVIIRVGDFIVMPVFSLLHLLILPLLTARILPPQSFQSSIMTNEISP
jgi:hypothetical protein